MYGYTKKNESYIEKFFTWVFLLIIKALRNPVYILEIHLLEVNAKFLILWIASNYNSFGALLSQMLIERTCNLFAYC